MFGYLRFLTRAARRLIVVVMFAAPATAGDLLGRAIDLDRPRPVATQGPFAGFVATPQVFYFGAATALLIAPDGNWFAAYTYGAAGSIIRLMDMRTGVLLRVLRTSARPLTGLAIAQDGKTVEALANNQQRLSWDAATGETLRQEDPVPGDNMRYLGLDKLGDLQDFVYVERRKPIPDYSRIVEFLRRHGLADQFPDPAKIDRILRSADGRYAIITEAGVEESDAARLKIWDLQRPSPPWTATIPDDWYGYGVSAFAFDGHFLVISRGGGEGDHRDVDLGVFEATNGVFKPLWRRSEEDWEGPCEISPNARYLSVGATPNGPVTVWDIDKARRTVDFNPVETAPILSSDSSTFAVARGPEDDPRAPEIMVFRHGKRVRLVDRTTDWPPDSTRFDIRALSPNGRYLLTSMMGMGPAYDRNGHLFVELWDIDASRQIDRFSLPNAEEPDWRFARVSDEGKLLLLRGGAVLRSGKWVQAAQSDNALIAPLDKDFKPVCGVVFCDHALADLGVVERIAPDDAKVNDAELHINDFTGDSRKQSPNGRFLIGKLFDSASGDFKYPGVVVDVETGRTLLETPAGDFTADSRYVIESEGGYAPITLREISSGKRVWTLYVTPDLGFVVTFADGRIRATPGAEKFFELVRGFEVKPYDDAARRLFQRQP